MDQFLIVNSAIYIKVIYNYCCVLLKCKYFKEHYKDSFLMFPTCYESWLLKNKKDEANLNKVAS